MANFEDTLTQMTKPEVPELKHKNILANAIIRTKSKSAVSWWWISVPLYVICAFVMKSLYMPHATLASNLKALASKDKYAAFLFFLTVPLVLIVVNVFSIKEIYFLSGSPRTIRFFKTISGNVSLIVLSVIIIIIFLFT